MTKKTILLFSIFELTELYGKLNNELVSDHFTIINVAYSDIEAHILKQKYNAQNIIVYKNEVIKESESILIDDKFLNQLDELFIKQTDGRFNLNGSIQSDRTYKYKRYEEALKATAICYNVWKKIFTKQKIDFFVHEPTSMMMSHMASILCKEQGGFYCTHIMVQGTSEYNFIMVDSDSGIPNEINYNYKKITEHDIIVNKQRIEDFLTKFRLNYHVFFDILGSNKTSYKLYFSLIKLALKEQLVRLLSRKKLHNFADNIEYFFKYNQSNTKRLRNQFAYRKIKYDSYNPADCFYFYPLHLEPEAVVLYWADGIYNNQIKLIENIAAQLPPNTFLYVKDHPHLYGYREVHDYKILQSIPNVKLLAPHLPGKKIVNDSIGVITLNGTAGYEALLLNKQVFTFGSSFYGASKRVKFVRNIKDFKDILYREKNTIYQDDHEIFRIVLSILDSNKIGFTDFYGGVTNSLKIDMEVNIKNVAKGISEYFRNHINFVNEII